MKKTLFIFLILSIFLPFSQSQAALVTCGGANCTFCDFFVMINNIIKFVMTTLVPAIAVLMLVIGGVLFLFAGARPSSLLQAKGIVTSVIIGLLIIFSAWVIVNTVLTESGIVSSPSLFKWYEISCQTPSGGQQQPPPTGTAPIMAPGSQITADLPAGTIPADKMTPSAKYAVGNDVVIKWSGVITNSTPYQDKGNIKNKISGIFANLGKTDIALAQETSTQYKREGQSAVTYTKIEVTSVTENTIEIVATLTYDASVLSKIYKETIKRVDPVISIFNADTRELLQNLTPESFNNVTYDNNVLTFKSSFERIQNGDYVSNIVLYFKGTFYLDFGDFTGKRYGRTSGHAWYIDPASLAIEGDTMPLPYIYDINWTEFPRPTISDLPPLNQVRGSGIWKYYPGYGWKESLEEFKNGNWVLREEYYGAPTIVLPRCEIPTSGWGAPSPEAATNIKSYYAKGIPCESTTATQRVDLILYQNGNVYNEEIASDILNTGSYVWKISEEINPAIYNIKIRNANNAIMSQTSLFEITGGY